MTDGPSRQAVIYAVVLAAGASARLGRPKQLLPVGSQPLLERTLGGVAASAVDGVVVVLGHAAEAIQAAIDFGRYRARVVVNARYAEGQSTSMRAGLDALPTPVDAALFVLGDQPLPDARVYDALLAAYQAGPDPIVVPLYGGRRGNPVVIPRRFWPALRAVRGDRGARDVVAAHRADTIEVAVRHAAAEVVMDVDDEEDYRRLIAHLGEASTPAPGR